MHSIDHCRSASARALYAFVLACGLCAGSAWSEEEAADEGTSPERDDASQQRDATVSNDDIEEVIVTGSLRSLPGDEVRSVFGFSKSLLELSRSASTVSWEQIERFNIKDIDELVAMVPGTFTQSFFGIAGSLEVRGTTGENYFRGIRRLDNPGNFPTPIAAADRIEIVRGPASPIHGPAKIGGFLNFVPKSARAETGQYLEAREGAVSVTTGSWGKRVLTGEGGGPVSLGGQDLGAYLYGEIEDSDSYYDNSDTSQVLLQASFDMDLTDTWRIRFGTMVQDYAGNQIAGWNRLTQDLIDHGTYITGTAIPLDRDGDGFISHQEFDVDGDGFTDFSPYHGNFIPKSGETLEQLAEAAYFDPSLLALRNVGTARLEGHQVLVDPDDTLENQDIVLYFDVLAEFGGETRLSNQLYFESSSNLNENSYGFSQFHETYVVENKLVISGVRETGRITTAWQLSPSIRYTHFERGDDYTNEYFDRRDLTRAPSALDRRLLSTRIDGDYTEYYIGNYLDLGLAAMFDVVTGGGFNATVGVRHDTIDAESMQPVDKLLFASSNHFCTEPAPDEGCPVVAAEDQFGGVSWTVSISQSLPMGLRPYLTASQQSTVIAGQGSDIAASNLAAGEAFDTSKLLEVGLKGSLLEGELFFALSAYRQERTDFSAQAIVTNQSTETTGVEFELRWAVTERLLMTASWSQIEVINLQTLENGGRFSFIGAEDAPAAPPGSLFGGALSGNVQRQGEGGARRAGIPEHIASMTGTYSFTPRFAGHFSLIRADAVDSGFSGTVRLPAYMLLNVGALFEHDRWLFAVNAKNVTDERYFRANFPNLFGSVVVLPELPRHYAATLEYRF